MVSSCNMFLLWINARGKCTSDYLTHFELRRKDFHGAFSETTGTNAPIYFQGWGEDDFDVHSCVENWMASGVSTEKISKLLFQ